MPHTQPLTRTQGACALILSELFPNGDLPSWYRNAIARDLDRQSCTIAEMETLLWNDVYPALIWNLLYYPGQSGGFEEDQVRHAMEWWRVRNNGWVGYLKLCLMWVPWSRVIGEAWEDVRRGWWI